MYCTTCGKELPDGTPVCVECGTALSPDGLPPSPGKDAESETPDEETTDGVQAAESKDGRRPYMDYKPHSREQASYGQNPYEQNAYWQTPYGEEAPADPGRAGLAIASLVLGILAMCSCCLPVVTVPLGILAVIFAVLGMRSVNRGLAIAGLVLGIIALVLGTMMLVIFLLSTGGAYAAFWSF